MDIATDKAEVTTRTRATTQTQTHTPLTQPLTCQHDIKSLAHRKQVDGSTVCLVHIGDINVEISNIKFHHQWPGFKP